MVATDLGLNKPGKSKVEVAGMATELLERCGYVFENLNGVSFGFSLPLRIPPY